MRILYYHQHFKTPSASGGTRSYEFSKKLIERGHKVTMVCGEAAKLNLPATNNKNIFRGDVDGIDVMQISLPYSNHASITKRTWLFIVFAYIGVKIALKENYDVLFATSTPLTAGVPGIFAKWFRKKKFIFEVRDLWPELPKALGMKNPFLLGGMSFLEKLTYKKADACIGLSPGICDGIKKRSQSGKKVSLISNGCDLDLFQPSQDKGLELEGVEKGDKVAIFTGAHGIANGLEILLKTAEYLQNANHKNIKIVLIGDGKCKPQLLQQKEELELTNIIFHDPVPKKELMNYVSKADVGLMVLANVPAFYFGTSPNKFFDYLAAGLPIINNYPGWLAGLIKDNKCGEVVEPDNAKAFAEAIVRVVNDKSASENYGRNARLLGENQFSRDDLGIKFAQFIESVV